MISSLPCNAGAIIHHCRDSWRVFSWLMKWNKLHILRTTSIKWLANNVAASCTINLCATLAHVSIRSISLEEYWFNRSGPKSDCLDRHLSRPITNKIKYKYAKTKYLESLYADWWIIPKRDWKSISHPFVNTTVKTGIYRPDGKYSIFTTWEKRIEND